MSRSWLPESTADRIAVAFTFATMVGLVWLVAAAPQESFAAAGAALAAHVDERTHAASPIVADCFPAQLEAPQGAPAKPTATS